MTTAFNGLMSGINTSIPGYVLSFDNQTQLAEVQIALRLIDLGNVGYIPPPIVLVPVHFYGGNEFVIEHQIDHGDEGLIIFSQRCIDAWVDQGGVAPQSMRREFDAADAMFIPGFRSQPNKISGFANNGIKLRDKSGSNFIWLKNDGTGQIDLTTLNVNADIIHVGDTTQTGDHNTTGAITATVSVDAPIVTGSTSMSSPLIDATSTLTANGKNLGIHTHPAGNPPDNTGTNN